MENERRHDQANTDHDLLVRIDERTKGMADTFVTKQEFKPIRLIVYGLVGLILISVFTALLAKVIVR